MVFRLFRLKAATSSEMKAKKGPIHHGKTGHKKIMQAILNLAGSPVVFNLKKPLRQHFS